MSKRVRREKPKDNGHRRQINFVTVYKQMEMVYKDGIRRIDPIFVRPIDQFSFAKNNTSFTEKTKYRIEVIRNANLSQAYKRVVNRSGDQPQVESVEKGLPLIEVFDRLLKKSIHWERIRRLKRAFKRLLTEPLGRRLIKSGVNDGKKSYQSKDDLKKRKRHRYSSKKTFHRP